MHADDGNTGITLQTLLGHMQGMKYEILTRMDGFEKRMDGLDAKIDRVEENLTTKIEGVEYRLTAQIDGLDQRLDLIEIAIVEQKHEVRIRRLEKHAGFTRA